MFRNISGMDNSIDRGEYGAAYQSTHPFGNPYQNSMNANREFSFADRNRNGRLEFNEFMTSPFAGGYSAGSFTFGYGF